MKLIDENGDIDRKRARSRCRCTVNATTNSVTSRHFPNPRGELLPGLFLRARLEEGSKPDAILVPQLAVSRNAKGEPTALVVGTNGMVELRLLQTPRAVGNQWLVTAGLKPGDQVIVDNLQKIRPGIPGQGCACNTRAVGHCIALPRSRARLKKTNVPLLH